MNKQRNSKKESGHEKSNFYSVEFSPNKRALLCSGTRGSSKDFQAIGVNDDEHGARVLLIQSKWQTPQRTRKQNCF